MKFFQQNRRSAGRGRQPLGERVRKRWEWLALRLGWWWLLLWPAAVLGLLVLLAWDAIANASDGPEREE